MYNIFIKNQIRIVKNNFIVQWPFSFREWLVVIFLFGYLVGGYVFFFSSIRFILSFSIIGELLLEKLWHFYFFTLWIMLVFSNAIIQYTNQYQTRETQFLFSLPIMPDFIFFKQLFQGILWSSWAFIFLSIPLLISFGIVLGASSNYFVGCILFLIPYLFLASVIGSVIAWICLNLPRKTMRHLSAIFYIIIFSIVLFNILKFPSDLKGEGDTQIILFLDKFLNGFSLEKTIFLPSTWFSQGLLSFALSKTKDGVFFFCLILFTSIVFFDFLREYAKKIYPSMWQKAQTSNASKKASAISIIINKFKIPELIKKDLIIFSRDTSQIAQTVIILLIMVLYITNLKSMQNYIDHPFWASIIFSTNICAIGLMIATFSLRFVFPQFSLEWRRRWIIGLVPMSFQRIVIMKFLVPFFCFLILGESINILSNIILKSSIIKIFFSSWIILILNIGLVSLSLCLGILYPRLEDDNPSRIMSGVGGILNLVFSMAYIMAILIPISLPFHFKAMGKINHVSLYYLWIGIVLFLETLLCFTISYYLFQKVKNKENLE